MAYLILFYAFILEGIRKILMVSNSTIKLIFLPGINPLRDFNSQIRAKAEFIKAKKNVPAYKDFLDGKNYSTTKSKSAFPVITEIPICDKENYIKKYTLEQRCVKGKVPSKGIVIDESSGSSGTATNWIRGNSERKRNAKFIKFGAQTLLGNGPIFVINAFALGPWATGMNITMSCLPFSKLKSVGPDKVKIENTLLHFGTGHKYLILGYPPFLKVLVTDSKINWKEYDITFILGGESLSEGMREYMIDKGIKNVYSSFGASDLELNIASENDFTICLRKLLRDNESLRKRILKHTGALPMVFQFNPADFIFENNEIGELIVTICRPGYVSPKIRYNIHDKGHVLKIKELFTILKELQIEDYLTVKPSTDIPILLHYGRADMAVSFFGSNITPQDIQETVFNLPELCGLINSFCITTIEDINANKKLVINFEFHDQVTSEEVASVNNKHFTEKFFKRLAESNQDFREAKRMSNNPDLTVLNFYSFGTGIFNDGNSSIKAKYLL